MSFPTSLFVYRLLEVLRRQKPHPVPSAEDDSVGGLEEGKPVWVAIQWTLKIPPKWPINDPKMAKKGFLKRTQVSTA